MAYVALAATSITFVGESGAIYEMPITQSTAVGYGIFADNNPFIRFGENVRIVDGFTADSVNAGDYLELWVNSKDTGFKYLLKKMTSTVSAGRITSSWIRAGAQIQLYHYSA